MKKKNAVFCVEDWVLDWTIEQKIINSEVLSLVLWYTRVVSNFYSWWIFQKMSLFETLDNKHEKLSGFCDLYVFLYTEKKTDLKITCNSVSALHYLQCSKKKKLISNLYFIFSYSNPSTWLRIKFESGRYRGRRRRVLWMQSTCKPSSIQSHLET